MTRALFIHHRWLEIDEDGTLTCFGTTSLRA